MKHINNPILFSVLLSCMMFNNVLKAQNYDTINDNRYIYVNAMYAGEKGDDLIQISWANQPEKAKSAEQCSNNGDYTMFSFLLPTGHDYNIDLSDIDSFIKSIVANALPTKHYYFHGVEMINKCLENETEDYKKQQHYNNLLRLLACWSDNTKYTVVLENEETIILNVVIITATICNYSDEKSEVFNKGIRAIAEIKSVETINNSYDWHNGEHTLSISWIR